MEASVVGLHDPRICGLLVCCAVLLIILGVVMVQSILEADRLRESVEKAFQLGIAIGERRRTAARGSHGQR